MINFVWHVLVSLVKLALLPWTLLYHLVQKESGKESKKEAYETFDHLALNTKRPTTEWLNMGNWTDTDDFAEACEQLARHLIRAADVQQYANILDVGHGNGDSLLLLLREYMPHTLHGVTSIRAQANRAEQRIQRASRAQRHSGKKETTWRIWCEEAVPFVERMANDANGIRYDVILALDCVYHFTPSRQRFLSACVRLLKPGGTIAMQDLMAAHPYATSSSLAVFQPSPSLPPPPPANYVIPLLQRGKHAFVLWLSDTPSVNIVPVDAYIAQLRQAGFEAIRVHDSSHIVFPGFAVFLQGLGKGHERSWRGGGTLQLFGLRMFGSVVHTWAQGGKEGLVRSVTTTAKRHS